MTNSIDTVRKQHFWEYFSGSKLQEAPASPSFTDDFSSSAGWTSVINTHSSVSGGKLIGVINPSGSNGDGIWKDYGLIFDDDKFVLRCKFQIVTQSGQSGNACTLYFGLSDTSGATSPSGNRDGFAIAITNYSLSGMLWNYPNGQTWDNEDTDLSLTPTQTTYYLEFKRTSATSVTFTLYSDSGFSTIVRTHTQSISSSLNGLRYLMMQGWRNGASNTTKVEVSNLELYNGVSSTDDVGVRWTWKAGTGGTVISQGMANDFANGGYYLRMTNGHYGSYDFNNIRQYNPTGSVVIGRVQRSHNDGQGFIGFRGDRSQGTGYADGEGANITIRSTTSSILGFSNDSSGSGTGIAVGTSDDNAHTLKVELSSDVKFYVDGVLGGENSINKPSNKLQPMWGATAAGSSQGSYTSYIEAYNT